MDGVYSGLSEVEGMCRERHREEERQEGDNGESVGEVVKVLERHLGRSGVLVTGES